MKPQTSRFEEAVWADDPDKITIVVGGAGGIGSNVIFQLAKIGYSLTIFDHDVVETHNVRTQMYYDDQIGRNKVESLKETLRYCSNAKTTAVTNRYDPVTYSPIMIACFDNMVARKQMFETWKSYDNRELFIDGRMFLEQFQVFAVQPGREKEYLDSLFTDEEADIQAPSCGLQQTSHFGAGIGFVITSLVTNYISNRKFGSTIAMVPFYTEFIGGSFIMESRL